MKLTLRLSSAAAFNSEVARAVESVLGKLEEDELEAAVAIHGGAIYRLCGWWFKEPPDVTVEVDIEARTCRVIS